MPPAAAVVPLGAWPLSVMMAKSPTVGAAGSPAKVQIIPGLAAQPVQPKPLASNGGGRGRAEQEAVVQRMKEKFGAEIRTIIDYRRNK